MIREPIDLGAVLRSLGPLVDAAFVPPVAPLDAVLQATEVAFLSAGRNLESAIDRLRGLAQVFPRLEQSLGPERGEEFRALTDAIGDDVGQLAQELDSFLQESAALRTALVQIDLDVADLDRVVRTISNVSINARIQGNALLPRRQQVTAFVEQLGSMAVDAEQILAEVKETTAGVMVASGRMALLVQDLQQVLRVQVLPVLGRIAAMGRTVGGNRAELAHVSSQLERSMTDTFAEVSRLIMALQVGDSTRQRLERVRAIVTDKACLDDPALRGVGPDLAAALAEDAVQEVQHEVATAVQALKDVQDSSDRAIRTARDFYFGSALTAGLDEGGAASDALRLTGNLALIKGCLAGLRAEAGAVGDMLQVILGHERTLRHIANSVRLSGLNAVLICAKLGHEGNALRELARWLRVLTDQSDEIVTTLQAGLDTSRLLIARVGQGRVDAIGGGAAKIVRTGADLHAMVGAIRLDIAETTTALGHAATSLPRDLDGSVALLTRYLATTAQMAGFVSGLQGQRPLAVPVIVAGSDAETLLAALRRSYTMQRERDIHDAVTGIVASDPARPAAAEVSTEVDDLDDILF